MKTIITTIITQLELKKLRDLQKGKKDFEKETKEYEKEIVLIEKRLIPLIKINTLQESGLFVCKLTEDSRKNVKWKEEFVKYLNSMGQNGEEAINKIADKIEPTKYEHVEVFVNF